MTNMRILLLGELSGLHQELVPGLRALGHQITVGHSRLAREDFPSDIPLYSPVSNSRWSQARDVVSQLKNAQRLAGFDIVQIVGPKFFHWHLHEPLMRYLSRSNSRLVIVATACASDSHRYYAELQYSPCSQCLKHDLKSERCIYDRDDERRAEYFSYNLADAIVATHFEYNLVLSKTPFAAKVVGIPLPVDTMKHRPTPMPTSDRIRIWYGETRHGIKGGPSILEALNRLENGRLRTQVEILRTGRLSFKVYLDLIDSVHVIIDQASSYGMGMNALYALARGRIALSGAELKSLQFLGVSESDNAVFNIRPEPEQIVGVLETIISQPERLPDLGRKASDYVARYHDSKVIARRYEELYVRLLGTAPMHQSK